MSDLVFKRLKEAKEFNKYMEEVAKEQIKQGIEEAKTDEQSTDPSDHRETEDKSM